MPSDSGKQSGRTWLGEVVVNQNQDEQVEVEEEEVVSGQHRWSR